MFMFRTAFFLNKAYNSQFLNAQASHNLDCPGGDRGSEVHALSFRFLPSQLASRRSR